jgi:hypothetical protein
MDEMEGDIEEAIEYNIEEEAEQSVDGSPKK